MTLMEIKTKFRSMEKHINGAERFGNMIKRAIETEAYP